MADQLKNAQVIFVLGGPGCGKGTQCAKLVEKYKFTHLSSGDLLRDEVSAGTDLGKQLQKTMEAGELVSLETVLQLIKNAMIKKAADSKGFLIDGYPRELDQGKQFEEKIAPCKVCVTFDVSEEVMQQRLMKRGETSGRADDNAETIKKRFATFKEKTKPVIQHYEDQKKLIKIDASGAVDDIFAKLCTELEARGVGK